MASDAGLCALAHLDLDGCAGLQIILVDAEAAAGYLDDGIGAVLVKIIMQAAFTGIVEDAERGSCPGQGGMGIVADGSVAHGGKHDRHGQADLGRQVADQIAVCVSFHPGGLFAERDMGLHGLAQRINGRIGHLRGIDQNFVPVNWKGLGIAHGREQDAAAGGLLVDLTDRVMGPVGVFTKLAV